MYSLTVKVNGDKSENYNGNLVDRIDERASAEFIYTISSSFFEALDMHGIFIFGITVVPKT